MLPIIILHFVIAIVGIGVIVIIINIFSNVDIMDNQGWSKRVFLLILGLSSLKATLDAHRLGLELLQEYKQEMVSIKVPVEQKELVIDYIEYLNKQIK